MIDRIISTYEVNKTKRSNWEAQWSEISDLFLPEHNVNWSLSDLGNVNEGIKKGSKIFNSTPVIALSRFIGVVEGLLTPIDKKWHSLKPKNPALKDNKAVQDWFYIANELLFDYRYNSGSNFAAQNSMRFEQMGAFGTGILFVDYDVKQVLRYKCIHVKDAVLGQNHQGVVNRVDRIMYMTVPEILATFDDGVKLSSGMRSVLDTKEENTKTFQILHATVPMADDKWGSYYIALKEKVMMMEGEYSTFPYSVSRYSTSPGEVFGRGPAMQALADVKRLNKISESVIKAIDKTLDPTLLAKDTGMVNGKKLVMTPNTLLVGGLDHAGNRTIVPFQDGARVDVGDAEIIKLENSIKDVFLLTLFEIMVETPRMTATEVLKRSQEKSMLLTPLVARQQNESLGPMIERELDILIRNGKLPPMPEEMDSVYDVVFQSPLNKMKDSDVLTGLIQVINTLLPMAADNPGLFDKINMDLALEMALESVGVPSVILRTDAEMKQRRERTEQAQQEQVLSEQMMNAAKATKDLSGVDIGSI